MWLIGLRLNPDLPLVKQSCKTVRWSVTIKNGAQQHDSNTLATLLRAMGHSCFHFPLA